MLVPVLEAAAILAFLAGAVESRSRSTRLGPRDNGQPVQAPIPPSMVAGYEIRGSGSHATTGDYVEHGLGATMDMVDTEYGLRDSESFYWGLDGRPMSNVTAYVDGKNVKVLSLERFDGVIEGAQCTPDSIKLTFTKEVQFDQVQSGWAWIDEAEDNFVVLVTETSRCNIQDGDATVRQPWHVTHAEFDDGANVVTLTAEPKTWNEAFGNWHLTYDTRGLLPEPSPSTKRALSPRFDGEVNIPLAIDADHTFDFDDGSSVAVNVTTTGSLDFRIEGDFSDLQLSTSIQVIARDLSLRADLLARLPAGVQLSVAPEIALGPGQFAGSLTRLLIPELNFEIGPALVLGVEASLTANNEVDIATSLDWKLDNPEAFSNISFTDFTSTPELGQETWNSTTTPLDVEISNDVSLTGAIGPFVGVRFSGGISVLGVGGELSVGLTLAAPVLSLTGEALPEAGACGVPEARAGIDLTLGVGAAFFATQEASAGLGILGTDVAATQPIFDVSTSLTSTCIAITTGFPQFDPSGTGNVPLPTGSGVPYGNTSSVYPWGTSTCSVNGALLCRDETHFGLCNWGKVIWQPVAAGTGCYAGRIVGTGIYAVPTPAPTAPTDSGTGCTHGLLYCSTDGSQYALCNWGNLTFQPVAQGTVCQAGKIVGAGAYAVPPAPTTPPTLRLR